MEPHKDVLQDMVPPKKHLLRYQALNAQIGLIVSGFNEYVVIILLMQCRIRLVALLLSSGVSCCFFILFRKPIRFALHWSRDCLLLT